MSALILGLATAASAMVYPPEGQPTMLACTFVRDPITDKMLSPRAFVLYSARGIENIEEVEIIDETKLLERRPINREIRNEKYWFLFNKRDLLTAGKGSFPEFSLMLRPPERKDDYYLAFDIAILHEKEVVNSGTCLSVSGPDATKFFEQAKADPVKASSPK